MALQSRAVNVAGSPVQIRMGHHAFDDVLVSLYYTSGGGTLYAGGSDVDVLNGFPVPADVPFTIPLGVGDELWLIASSAMVVQVMQSRR